MLRVLVDCILDKDFRAGSFMGTYFIDLEFGF